MGRRKKRGEAPSLPVSPSRLSLSANFSSREGDVWVRCGGSLLSCHSSSMYFTYLIWLCPFHSSFYPSVYLALTNAFILFQFQNQIAELGALQYRARDEAVLPANLYVPVRLFIERYPRDLIMKFQCALLKSKSSKRHPLNPYGSFYFTLFATQ